eukprot:410545_1
MSKQQYNKIEIEPEASKNQIVDNLAKFKKIDKLVNKYFSQFGIDNYCNANGNGQFLQFIIDQGFEDKDIIDELGDHCKSNNCTLLEFDVDNRFPLHINIDSDYKQYIIFYVLQYCHKFNSLPTTEYLQSKIFTEQISDKISFKLVQSDNLHRLKNVFDKYANDKYDYNQINIDVVLNDYLYLLQHYNNENEFEYIFGKLGGLCEMNSCNVFKRNFRNRKLENNLDNQMIKFAFKQQIMDKIHCYYRHCFDVGYQINWAERQIVANSITDHKMNDEFDEFLVNSRLPEINKLLHNKKKLFQNITSSTVKYTDLESNNGSDDLKLYSFGFKFIYGYDGEYGYKRDTGDFVYVYPTFPSLKNELTQNDISTISIEQFNNEYKKAQIHFLSD